MKASQEFKVGKNKIAWIGSNFKDWFSDCDMKPSKATLYGKTLERYMSDLEIQKEFGTTEVTLGEILNAMKTNKELLTNGYSNIFYVRDPNDATLLRAVGVRWNGVGWYVYASALDDYRWYDGCQVFSRNSSTPQTPVDTLSPGVLDPSNLDKKLIKDWIRRNEGIILDNRTLMQNAEKEIERTNQYIQVLEQLL